MPVLGKPTEYNFYVDVEWRDSRQYDNAIKQILKYTHNFNILGEYEKFEEQPSIDQFKKPEQKKYIQIKKLG